jgi:hypothetical protein
LCRVWARSSAWFAWASNCSLTLTRNAAQKNLYLQIRKCLNLQGLGVGPQLP